LVYGVQHLQHSELYFQGDFLPSSSCLQELALRRSIFVRALRKGTLSGLREIVQQILLKKKGIEVV
jgi:hypothetical protein